MIEQEFGEVLAEIRDHLDVPLACRVSQPRVFGAAVILTLGVMAVALRGPRRLPTPGAIGLPEFEDDADDVLREFKNLDGLRCNSIQVEQAKELFHEVMARLQHRQLHEKARWLSAVQAGIFLSSLAMMLLVTSSILALLTIHSAVNMVFMALFVGIQLIASIIADRVFLS